MFSFKTTERSGRVITWYISLEDLQRDFPDSWELMTADEIISAYAKENRFANY